MIGWNENTGLTNHSELIKYVNTFGLSQALYVQKDCQLAVSANPSGKKTGYYLDLIAYCGMRIRKLREKI